LQDSSSAITQLVGSLIVPVLVGVLGLQVALAIACSLALDPVQDDPRWARHVAEWTGFVPTSLLVVPIIDDADELLGVLLVPTGPTTVHRRLVKLKVARFPDCVGANTHRVSSSERSRRPCWRTVETSTTTASNEVPPQEETP
jgi:hypothetical protein